MGFFQVYGSDRSRFVVHPAWRLMKVIYNFCIFFVYPAWRLMEVIYKNYLQLLYFYLFIYEEDYIYIIIQSLNFKFFKFKW